jgi:hypothetical protein
MMLPYMQSEMSNSLILALKIEVVFNLHSTLHDGTNVPPTKLCLFFCWLPHLTVYSTNYQLCGFPALTGCVWDCFALCFAAPLYIF